MAYSVSFFLFVQTTECTVFLHRRCLSPLVISFGISSMAISSNDLVGRCSWTCCVILIDTDTGNISAQVNYCGCHRNGVEVA